MISTTRYLTLSELIYINGTLLDNDKLISGKQKVRDLELLEAAAARPSTSAFGEDAYPTLREKVAALVHSLARNHPFADGNKRTATVAAIFMLEINGECVAWQPPDALTMILDVAEGRTEWPVLAGWFPVEPCTPAAEPDAERDMQTITRILEQHRWLLDELARQ